MSLVTELKLDNESFSQELNDLDNDSFEVRRRLTRVQKKRPAGRVVYSKTGKRLKGRYVRK